MNLFSKRGQKVTTTLFIGLICVAGFLVVVASFFEIDYLPRMAEEFETIRIWFGGVR